MSFAYSVAIKLTVANLASQGVKILAKDLLAAHGNAVALGDKLKALKLMAVGYGMDKAGEGILGFMSKSIDMSKEYTRQLSLMNGAGMGQQEIAKATAAAWSTTRNVVTSTAADNLKAIRELRTVFGNGRMEEAYGILPTVQRTKGILEALTGKEQEGVAFDMVKAIELRTPGVMTAARMQQNVDQFAQSLMGFGGTLNAHDLHMALKQTKTAAFGLNDDFVFKYLPTLMQEVKTGQGGAQSAGTAIMSAYQAVIGGVLKKSAIPLWEQMGLIAPSDVVRTGTGQMQLKPGAVKDSQLFQSNPYAWANQVLAPAIQSYGASHGLNQNQVISGMFGNRNVQWLMSTFIGKSRQFERDKNLINSGGNSYDTYQKLLQKNPMLAEQAMHAQMQNVMAIIGYRVLPTLVPWMVKFANGLDRVGQFLQNHPALSSGLAFGLLGVGAALTVVGKALMTVGLIRFLGMGPMFATMFSGIATGLRAVSLALFANPVGLALLGIAGAALLIYNNWNEIKGSVIRSLADFKDGFVKLFHGDILGAFGSFAHAYLLSFQTLLNTIIAGVNTILPTALQISKVHFADDKPAAVPSSRMPRQGGDVYLDGKKVGKVMTPHLLANVNRAASRPNSGPSGVDWSRAKVPPTLATAR